MSHHPFGSEELDSLADLLPAYQFECLIAQVGLGAVYKARQVSLDRDVAIKILSRELGEDPLFRDSFEAEAKAMARLSHANLIKVYEFGNLNGLLYIAMEYVPGKSLFHSAHRKAIDPAQAVEIVIAACRGLAHAHENGIIHRDIKPTNIQLTPKCEPKIGDFGLACRTRRNVGGLAIGTAEYMAPEVIDHPEKGDRQSDVFSMGVILRELLTGIPAGHEEASRALISDPGLAEICRNATHADLALRYPDASAFAEDLKQWTTSKAPRTIVAARHPVSLRPASYRPTPVSQVKRKPSTAWNLLKNCAVITGLLGTGYFSWSVHQLKQEAMVKLQQARNSNAPIESLEAAAGEGFTVSANEGESLTTVTVHVSYLDLLVRQGAALTGRATE